MKQLAAIAALWGAAAYGGALSTSGANPGAATEINSITGFTTTGDQMAGMKVSVTFVSGQTDSCIWGVLGANSGGCSTQNFEVSQTGDTFNSDWSYNTDFATASILFEGVLGPGAGVVFDRTNPDTGTPGTAQGADASGTTVGADGEATYMDIVNILGFGAVGDIYAKVEIVFGPRGATSATWIMDTDTVGVDRVIPEPGTFVLMGAGLAGAALLRRRF